jgi:ketosteroid isomerase-like protein
MNNPRSIVRSALVVMLLLVSVAGASPSEDAETGIAETIEGFMSALNNADVEALVATFTEDATAFLPLASNPTRVGGHTGLREVFGPFFSHLRQRGGEPPFMHLAPHELKIQYGGDLAVATFHLSPIPEGELDAPLSFSRRTLILVRTADGWKILHLHASQIVVPAGTSIQ